MINKINIIACVCLLLGACNASDNKILQTKQEADKTESITLIHKPVVNLKGKKIGQIGIVVKDIEKSTKRLSEIFGIPSWVYLDLTTDKFGNVIMHDEFVGDSAKTHLRVATANVMDYQFELIQPVSGQSTHAEFLEKHGEGIHHLGLSPLTSFEHQQMNAKLKKEGVEVEMQGVLGKATTFTYLNMMEDLGMLFEIYSSDSSIKSTISPSGGYQHERSGVLNCENKKIVQVGMVVKDVKKAAKRYEELLGIGPWEFIDAPISNGMMHGQPIGHDEVGVKIALATYEGLGFELVQPVKGPSSHREFLEKHGNGIHHIAFSNIANKDDPYTYDNDLKLLKEEGIEVEMQGVIFGGKSMFTYLSSQDQLSGIIFEMGKRLDQ